MLPGIQVTVQQRASALWALSFLAQRLVLKVCSSTLPGLQINLQQQAIAFWALSFSAVPGNCCNWTLHLVCGASSQGGLCTSHCRFTLVLLLVCDIQSGNFVKVCAMVWRKMILGCIRVGSWTWKLLMQYDALFLDCVQYLCVSTIVSRISWLSIQ